MESIQDRPDSRKGRRYNPVNKGRAELKIRFEKSVQKCTLVTKCPLDKIIFNRFLIVYIFILFKFYLNKTKIYNLSVIILILDECEEDLTFKFNIQIWFNTFFKRICFYDLIIIEVIKTYKKQC
jgi:hypothetical protein